MSSVREAYIRDRCPLFRLIASLPLFRYARPHHHATTRFSTGLIGTLAHIYTLI